MMAKKDKTAIENETAYYMYYNRLRDYALSMFKWEGLPDTVNERFLEVQMFHAGKILFFKDLDNDGFLALPFTGGQLNVYNEYLTFTAFSTNYSKDYSIDNAVPIWANFSRTSIEPIVMEFAKRLYRVERALDVNIAQQKFPYIVLTDDAQRLTMENTMNQWDGYTPYIFGNKKGFDKEAIQILNTPAPFVADKLMQYKHDIWNQAMTWLGIGNAKQDKKERLVSDEVAANDEQIESSREVMLKARQLACEKINKMFGLDISVDYRLRELQEEQQEEAQEEGDNENAD
jgi:hypothetical protein